MARKKRLGEGPGISGGPVPRTREFYLKDSVPKPPVSIPRKESAIRRLGKNKGNSTTTSSIVDVGAKDVNSLQVRSKLLDVISLPHPPLAFVDRLGEQSGVDRPGTVEAASLDATAGAGLALTGAAQPGTVEAASLDATAGVDLAQTGAAQSGTVENASLDATARVAFTQTGVSQPSVVIIITKGGCGDTSGFLKTAVMNQTRTSDELTDVGQVTLDG